MVPFAVQFLFRYPTDTDKHMLATQTGLSRNQVGVYPFEFIILSIVLFRFV